MIAMSIPYETAADEAPSYVTNFNVVAAPQGEKKVTLKWNNPKLNYQQGTLNNLTGVKIYKLAAI